MLPMQTDPSCAILVLNWNGRVHLAQLLPSLHVAIVAYGRRVPIVVVDNQSSDGDVAWVRAAFPDVEVRVAPRNDYLFSLNAAVAARREDVVVLLNNDMRVAPDFLAPLLAHFADPDLFAVAAAVYEWDGRTPQAGARRIRFERGWMRHRFDYRPAAPCYTAEAGGGCSAFRRTRFTALGGFDPLFRPGYWEDFDLTHRAWRRGWPSVFEPGSVVYHRGGASLGNAIGERALRRLLVRNQTLCLLKTVGGWPFALQVLLRLPYRIGYHALWGERAVGAGMAAALPRVPRALAGRLRLGPAQLSPDAIAAALDAAVRTGAARDGAAA
jgi:N-acetylglucosaminyl-diphospho-decaprenol L-rhamnosyltransferase